mgnify:FL=1
MEENGLMATVALPPVQGNPESNGLPNSFPNESSPCSTLKVNVLHTMLSVE